MKGKGRRRRRRQSHSFSHKSISLSDCFHLISSWCLHYRAARIRHQATLCCFRAICWRLGSGSNFTDIFRASRWYLTAIKVTWLSYISQSSGWWGKPHLPHQQERPCVLRWRSLVFNWSIKKERGANCTAQNCTVSAQGRKNVLCASNQEQSACRQMMGETWQKKKRKQFLTTSSSYNNFASPVPTHVSHSDFMSFLCHALLSGFAPSWKPPRCHRLSSHWPLPLGNYVTWWCNAGIGGVDRRGVGDVTTEQGKGELHLGSYEFGQTQMLIKCHK